MGYKQNVIICLLLIAQKYYDVLISQICYLQICVFKTWNLFSETMFSRAVGKNYIVFPKTGAVKHLLGIWVGGKIKSFERYRDVIGA